MASPALQFLVLTVAGWVTRHQLALLEYLSRRIESSGNSLEAGG